VIFLIFIERFGLKSIRRSFEVVTKQRFAMMLYAVKMRRNK